MVISNLVFMALICILLDHTPKINPKIIPKIENKISSNKYWANPRKINSEINGKK
jgi:hypothetical protein